MTSTRPYLIRAIYNWAQDNNLTPQLLVDATLPDVVVPLEFVEDGKIVLNVAASAVANLELGDEFIAFNARFSGVAHEIFIPTAAVRVIYARENGVGLVLPEDPEGAVGEEPEDPAEPPPRGSSAKVSHLKIVK